MNKKGLCKLCNKEFIYCDASQPGIYCSRPCKYLAHRGELKKANCKGCNVEIQWTQTKQRNYCKVECLNNQITSRTNEIIKENFEKKVIKQDGCWGWNGMINAGGYARMSKNNKKESAHRISYIIHKGEIPEGFNINHICHNKICTNPEHLYAGSQKQNVDDMLKANRAKHNSVLNEEQVIEIKRLIKEGKSLKDLSKKYKVNSTVISNIRRNKTWRHVTID